MTTKWLLIVVFVGAAVYLYRKNQDQVFDGHRLNKDLKRWKDYKHKMRVLAKEKEGVFQASVDPYQKQYSYDNETIYSKDENQEIEEILSVDKKIATSEENEYLAEQPKRIVKKKRWRWKGWRRK